VLLLGAALLGLWHERSRRRLFVSSFRRGRHGSSLVRTSPPIRAPGEPSTVDHAEPDGGAAPAEAGRGSGT